jgi:ABC-type branched-subunit amino acid transport system substrate-binding protein
MSRIASVFRSFRLLRVKIQPGFLALSFALLMTACSGGGYYGGGTTWPGGGDAVVTSDPSLRPDIAWQTPGQRREILTDLSRPSLIEDKMPQNAPRAAGPVKAALLVPLSGKSAALGSAMLKAAQMALTDVGSDRFELAPQDTASTPEGAAKAAAAAIADGADIILGPIFADDLKAIKPQTSEARIPVIAFTTDWTLAGGRTYVMGFFPFTQVARVAQFARENGHGRFAALAPKTEYADVSLNALSRAGVDTVSLRRYDAASTKLKDDVMGFVADNKTVSSDGAEKLTFNALLLPQGGESLLSLVSLLDLNGVNNENARFVGTGLWDDPLLTQRPALYGSWFAAPDPALRRDFERRFENNFGEKAPRLATLAYDAAALAAVLARSGGDDPYAPEILSNPRGFAGLDGIFRFRGDGLTERGLAVLEIDAGKLKVVSPAPTAFSSGS